MASTRYASAAPVRLATEPRVGCRPWTHGCSAPSPRPETPYAAGESEFRTDLERIRFAQSFSRLAEVTQVITAGATGGVVHNRLTHTIKVTAVARAIAVRLLRTDDRTCCGTSAA